MVQRRSLISMALLAVASARAVGAAAADPLSWPQRRFASLAARLQAAAGVLGYGNFNLADFDAVRRAATGTSGGAFTAAEEAAFEAVFALDARRIGFFGERVADRLTFALPAKELVQVPATSHRLYPHAWSIYQRARAAIGQRLVVTSGVRGVPKQLLLFLQHAARDSLSPPRHSVAPPGYSYHSVGDMDVGDARLGTANFTEAFERSAVCGKLRELSFIRFRYPRDNAFGVIYEPWHIQVEDGRRA